MLLAVPPPFTDRHLLRWFPEYGLITQCRWLEHEVRWTSWLSRPLQLHRMSCVPLL
uniref:Uncharacterized protein n=1 Tax=Streptomyces auratus AGR0001 TaxID=1160718 RepID=J1RV98_9ACTN